MKLKPYPSKIKHIGNSDNGKIDVSTFSDEQILAVSGYVKIGDYITVKHGNKIYKGKLSRMYYPHEYSPSAYMVIVTDKGNAETLNMDKAVIISVEEQ